MRFLCGKRAGYAIEWPAIVALIVVFTAFVVSNLVHRGRAGQTLS
jgi:hypothetical protein